MEASIHDGVRGDEKCPYCSGLKAIPDKTSLKYTHPELMKEWDYSYNSLIVNPDTILCKDEQKVWWLCKECKTRYLKYYAIQKECDIMRIV